MPPPAPTLLQNVGDRARPERPPRRQMPGVAAQDVLLQERGADRHGGEQAVAASRRAGVRSRLSEEVGNAWPVPRVLYVCVQSPQRSGLPVPSTRHLAGSEDSPKKVNFWTRLFSGLSGVTSVT